jgi:hypothetical protein
MRAIEIRDAGEDVLVHDPARNKVHVLNRTAGRVLALCDGTQSPASIAQSLSHATGADLPLVTRDVEAILREFEALELLENEPHRSDTTKEP